MDHVVVGVSDDHLQLGIVEAAGLVEFADDPIGVGQSISVTQQQGAIPIIMLTVGPLNHEEIARCDGSRHWGHRDETAGFVTPACEPYMFPGTDKLISVKKGHSQIQKVPVAVERGQYP